MELFAPLHILVILFVFIILFGPKKLPEMGRSLGEGIREFKKAIKEASSPEAESKPTAILSAAPSLPESDKQKEA